MDLSSSELDFLFSVEGIRESAQRMLQTSLHGKTCFRIHKNQLDTLAEWVMRICERHYPDWQIPLHSRWRHFERDGANRAASLFDMQHFADVRERVKAQLDLAVISVLLDAGAGSLWRYLDEQTHTYFNRSEGLALASLQLFYQGFFSDDAEQPWRVAAVKLQQITEPMLAEALQVTAENPLLGLTGRHQLLVQLGEVLQQQPHYFSSGRPGDLYDYLLQHVGKCVSAATLFKMVLTTFNGIWPNRITAHVMDASGADEAQRSVPLGDVWYYPLWQSAGLSLVPLHKLSLWLTLSLIEPLELAGIIITTLEQLPGLAEYRNGGLLIDGGVLEPLLPITDPHHYHPEDSLVIEWRALTLVLLEQLADNIRERLGVSAQALPLARLLQGGTWLAGRQLAYARRADGAPPLKVCSDATVF